MTTIIRDDVSILLARQMMVATETKREIETETDAAPALLITAPQGMIASVMTTGNGTEGMQTRSLGAAGGMLTEITGTAIEGTAKKGTAATHTTIAVAAKGPVLLSRHLPMWRTAATTSNPFQVPLHDMRSLHGRPQARFQSAQSPR